MATGGSILMVEACCLTWIYVDVAAEQVTRVRVHALPENLVFSDSPDVLAVDPAVDAPETDRRRAIMLARNTRLTFPFELMV